ncbi:MAG: enoyl-[acyl-carrier protein] reductase I [Pirellulaceae bacterium]
MKNTAASLTSEERFMGLFDGKKGLILGVANKDSIAIAIAKVVMDQGGECGFTHLPDRPDDDRKKNRRRVEKAIDGHPNAKFLIPLNVQSDENIAEVMTHAKEELGSIDFVLHSIAFADREDLKKDTIETSREGFNMAMDISAYSLLAVCREARGIMNDGGSILAMTYFGSEKIVPGYNVMGICKAALEAAVRYAAHDLGPRGIRVNALSSGPLKTLAASAAGAKEMLKFYGHISPLGRNIDHEEVGQVGAFLMSDMSKAITAETMHVDAGYNAMGSPGRFLEIPDVQAILMKDNR